MIHERTLGPLVFAEGRRLASALVSDEPQAFIPSGSAGGGSAFPAPRSARAAAGEALVADARAGLTPAQMVERKLVSLLDRAALPVNLSQVRTRGRLRSPGR